MTLTAHCVIKNEENFIWYAVKSVIDYVDQMFIFDTGSTDATVEIVKKLVNEYPTKIIFEEKGECDKKHHTELRQEMLDRTITDWFMILDGDEVWTKRGIIEARSLIDSNNQRIECLVAPFYLCVGDLNHYSSKGQYHIFGRPIHATLRFLKRTNGIHWQGQYNQDGIFNDRGQEFSRPENSVFLTNRFWHVSHLHRSSQGSRDYSSGGSRRSKIRLTYFIIGKKIKQNLPEVFDVKIIKRFTVSPLISFINFIIWITKKTTKIGI